METVLAPIGKSGAFNVMRGNEVIGSVEIWATTWCARVFGRAEAGAMVVENDSEHFGGKNALDDAHKWVAGKFWDGMRARFGTDWEHKAVK